MKAKVIVSSCQKKVDCKSYLVCTTCTIQLTPYLWHQCGCSNKRMLLLIVYHLTQHKLSHVHRHELCDLTDASSQQAYLSINVII